MRYTVFGEGSGLRVSALSLGGALFGQKWGYGADAAEAARIFDAYADAGGNFIDTADSYQNGESEEIVGKALDGRRERFVLATKFTLGAETDAHPLLIGNSRKTMVRSVEESLRRLATDRIDLLWVHMPDGLTSSEEIVRGLDDLSKSGKILYAGFSDFPAWRVARAATIAEIRGWIPLIGVQLEYSLVERSGDRELLPMARAMGLGVTAWSPLGGGLLTGKYRRGEEGRATTFGEVVRHEDSPQKTQTLDALIKIADERGVTPCQVALAWLIARGIVPIIGPRTAPQLAENLAGADVLLSDQEIERLSLASAPALGFPHDFLSAPMQHARLSAGLTDLQNGLRRGVA